MEFKGDLGLCPPGHTLERRNNGLGYQPGNCYWADRKAQANNVSRNRRLTWHGETKTMAQWADDPRVATAGISYTLLRARLRWNWAIEEALTQPVGSPRQRTLISLPRLLAARALLRNVCFVM